MLASDGLWDNLNIHSIREELFKNDENLVSKTKKLIRKAKELAYLEEY